MEQKRQQLTLEQKWILDIESYKKGGAFVAAPMCELCIYFIKGNVFHCDKYEGVNEKPKEVVCAEKECPAFQHVKPLSLAGVAKEDERVYAGIFGFIVGDALGVPVEFCTREARKQDPVQEMRAYGTYHQPYGTWSDDTSLTLCLLENIAEGYSLAGISEKFIRYYKNGYLTPFGEVFDIGNATRAAIEKMMQGQRPETCGGNTELDNGNGSLMRVLPLAYYLQAMPPRQRKPIIEEVSSLTHAHSRAKLACILYVEYAIHLLNGHNKIEAYRQTLHFVAEYCREDYQEELHHFRRILTENIASLQAKDINSTGYVVDSLEASLWAFMTTNDYKEAILTGINLGGDTDTIAAIIGGIAGIFYGIGAIPDTWLQCLARKQDIYELIKKFIGQMNASRTSGGRTT